MFTQVRYLSIGRQSKGQLSCCDVRAVSHLPVVQDLRDVPVTGPSNMFTYRRLSPVAIPQRHAAPRLEAPRHLRRGGARVLRVAQRADARAELAGRPGGQLRPGAEGAPHRVLLGL